MLIDVALPISLAVIMFSLGIGLTFADFGRVARMPWAVFVGIVLQVAGIPALAYLLLQVIGLPPALAFGVMILSFSPGGVTSNMLTKLAGGSVALSITLTAVVSLLSVLTVPVLVAWAASTFLAEAAPAIDVTGIAVAMFLITALPVFLGLLLRHFAERFAIRAEPVLSVIATILFVVIVLAALATNWTQFTESLPTLGPILVALNILALLMGILVARGLGLTGADATCISIELGVQNATLGITVGGLVAIGTGLSEFVLPSAVYGIMMYVVTLPAIALMRRSRTQAEA